MFLWWGDDLIQFYNDAYRPSLGNEGKHPLAVGQKGPECWPEIWNVLYPLIEQVRATGEAVWFEDQLVPIYRNGKVEDVYWTFSYSPVSNESGKVEGIFVVCTETTGKVNNLKKLEESEQRFRNLITEATVATALLTGPHMVIEVANKPMLALWGRDSSAIGRQLLDVIPELATQAFPQLLQEVFTTGATQRREDAPVNLNRNGKPETMYRDFSYKPILNEKAEVVAILVMSVDVTEKVLAREKLIESEQRYRMIIEEGTVATALYIGPEIRIQYVNDTMLRYWGKDSSVIGKTFGEALPELEGQPFPLLLKEVYTTGNTYVGKEELAYLEINGKMQHGYYNFTYKALRREDGTIYGIHHAAIDVTEQVMARKKTEEIAQKLRTVVESAPFPIAVYTGKEMLVELANQSIMDIWGKGNKVVGKLFTEVLPELNSQEVFDQIRMVYDSGIPFHIRHQRLDLIVNGKPRPYWFNYSLTPLFDASGNVYGVMNTGVDNTDLILAKLKVEENENNMRNTILKAPVAMCIFRGPQHVVEIANDRMIELWGRIAAEDVINKPIFESLPEIKNQGFEQLLHGVFTTGETFSAQGVPVTLMRNGKIANVFVNFVYAAFREAEGNISGVIAVATDVTDQVIARQQIEEVVAERTKELAEANSDLQKSNAELAQFAYIASHDLQEPVRKVATFAQMLEQSLGNVDERSQKYLSKISTASSRMTTLIRDVLSYSQLSKDKETLRPVDLQLVVQDIINDFELLIEQKQATIEYDGLPVVHAIPLQMSQLFGNLISNSLKFSRGDVPPLLRITATQLTKEETAAYGTLNNNATYYTISLKDNGIGFKQEYAEQIFNIFQRLHAKTDYEGTGIGLAMCRKIAQNHSGEIYATGTENGAVFNVILPVHPLVEAY